MDIAVDVRSLMDGRHSGVEQYTTRIIEGMLRVAPEHTYHLFYNASKTVKLPAFAGNIVVHSFRYPNKLLNMSLWLFKYPRWDDMVQADVFFVPNVRLLPLSSSTPLVTVAHDLSFEKFPEFLDLKRRIWHRIMSPRKLLSRSNHVIAVSAHTKRDLMRYYGLRPQLISVVYSGVEVQRESVRNREKERVRKKYNLPPSYILYFGALEPRKNLATLIRAFSAIASTIPHDLVIAGESGWRMSQVHKALKASKVRQRIHVSGFIQEEDKQVVYALAELFVYPSYYEGFGFPPLEALLAGTPVITSYNSSLPEVVGRWATLIDPHNASELALVMQELLREIPVVSDRVKNEVQQMYNWDRAARETIRIIEEVVS